MAWIQQAGEHADALETAGSDSGPAMEFGADPGRCLFNRDRFAIVHDPAAAPLAGQQRDHEIIHNRVAGDSLEERFSNGIDAAVGAQQGPEPAFAFLQECLVLPVKSIDVAPGFGVGQDQPAADDAQGRILKPGREPVRRRGMHRRVGVREQDDLAGNRRDGVVQDVRLAPSRLKSEELDAELLVTADDLVGAVGAAVGRHHDFQFVGRVVQLQGVFDAGGDFRFLVVGRNQQRDGRQIAVIHLGPALVAAKQPCRQPNEDRIAQVGIGDDRQADKENGGHDQVGRAHSVFPG